MARAKKREKFPTGKVYFVRSGKLIKIGFTTDLEGRVSRLQTGSPYDLQLLASIDGTRRDEQSLHSRFANLNVRGEWFRGHSSLMAYIRKVTLPPTPEPPVEVEPETPRLPMSPEARAEISNSLRRRNIVGAESREGRLLSNLIQQIRNYRKEEDPTARAHLEWGMNWTRKLLAELP